MPKNRQAKPKQYYRQSAVIPFRRDKKGKLRVLLITTRKSRRWIVPKGIVEPGMTPAASAAKEAYEEAGVQGRVSKKKLGTYHYEKWGGTCKVKVYLLEVTKVLGKWPESSSRTREWVSAKKAATLVNEPGLRRLLKDVKAAVASFEAR